MDPGFVLTRLLQFAGAAVLCGAPLFLLYGARGEIGAAWVRRMVRAAAVVGAAATLGWLMLQTAALGDGPGDALRPAAVWSVAADTGFGRAAGVRLLAFAAAACVPVRAVRLLAILGTVATVSFAWTGHGATDEGAAGMLHLAADILHLIAAAVWIGALVALAILAWRARRGRGAGALLGGLARFSDIGLAVVAALTLTGLVNSWFLIGPNRLGDLVATLYGRLLLAKLALFAGMLMLAAANRYRLTPSLAAAEGAPARTAAVRRLTTALTAETLLGIGVLLAVSALGTLAPPISGG